MHAFAKRINTFIHHTKDSFLGYLKTFNQTSLHAIQLWTPALNLSITWNFRFDPRFYNWIRYFSFHCFIVTVHWTFTIEVVIVLPPMHSVFTVGAFITLPEPFSLFIALLEPLLLLERESFLLSHYFVSVCCCWRKNHPSWVIVVEIQFPSNCFI